MTFIWFLFRIFFSLHKGAADDVRLVANGKLKLYHNHYLFFRPLAACCFFFILIFNFSNASLYTSVNEMKAEIHVIAPVA